MANSSVLTSAVERRNKEPNVAPVWERKVTFTIDTGGGSTELSHTVIVNGTLKQMVIEVGAAAGITGTVNVDFDDNNGVEFDANATLGEASETIVTPNSGNGVPVDNFIIRADPSDDPTSGIWEITVTCRGN